MRAPIFVPPRDVARAARLGLEFRHQYRRGGTQVGVIRAHQLSQRKGVSLATVKRMKAFFSRHHKNYRPDVMMPDGGPTAGTIAWLLWGGSAGMVWAEMILSR